MVLAACLMSVVAQAQQAPRSEVFPEIEAFVDGYVGGLMANQHSPSGTVAVASGEGVFFAKGYGFQDIEKGILVNAETTLFRPGSVSKLFTWVAVMQQVEQGKLDLDTDVNRYLENFQIEDSWPGQPVTLRHILTHTAGFEEGGLGYLIVDDVSRLMPLAESMKRYQHVRVNPPGAQTAYSNYGAALAGLIVSNVSGLSFNDYIQKNIFDVLGMQSASFEEPLPERLANNMANTYVLEGGKYASKPYELISNFGPAGALAATATDMLKFGLAILNGGEYNGKRILRASTVDEVLNKQFSHDPRMPGMGLGFYQTEVNGNLVVGHGGDTMSFHSDMVIDRTHKLVIYLSFNAVGGAAVRSGFPRAFYDKYFPVEKTAHKPPTGFSERAGKYAGSYQFWRSNFSTIQKAMMLASGFPVAAMPDDTLMIGEDRYVEVEPNLFKLANPHKSGIPVIAFQENADGDVTGFVAEGLPFMSTFKASAHQTSSFNLTLLGLSLLAFVGVWLRYLYRRGEFAALPAADKSARRSSLVVASANLLTVIVGGVVVAALGMKLFGEIPWSFKAWLLLPLIAFIAGFYQLYQAANVWRGGLLGGIWGRVGFTLVTLAALFMCWFYWYWNILGWQYLT